MFAGHRIGALVLMAGEGKRCDSATPKQFIMLEGMPLYRYALHTLVQMAIFDEIVLVCHPNWVEKIAEDEGMRVVAGGATRQESSYAGVCSFLTLPDIVLVHDAVRPFITREMVEENVRMAILYGAVDTCIPSADTIVLTPDQRTVQSIPNRNTLLRGQTPQTFRAQWLVAAHEKARRDGICNASDDCTLLLHAGYPVRIVMGRDENFKITVDFDLVIAKGLLQNRLN